MMISRIFIILFIWFQFQGIFIHFVFCCIPGEREALLQFKNELTDRSNRLASWIHDSDCCRWSGVVCHNVTGNVLELHVTSNFSHEDYLLYGIKSLFGGKISPSLLYLKHLKYLDLSDNDFGGIPIPKFLGSMTSLRYLNLGRAEFGGMIPHQLGNLSNLHYLNLNDDFYVESLHWISSLRSLEFIDLSGVNLSKAYDWLDVLNTLPSLVELHLSNCELYPIDHHLPLVNFSSLAVLDLRFAFQPQEVLVPHWIFGIKTLTSLDLSGNHFLGPIPSHIQNLTSLIQLGLASNEFNSSIPDWWDGFSQLEFLYLQSNGLEGRIPSSLGNLTSLNTIDLSYNKELEGGIPASFKNLCNLRSLNLGNNNLNGTLPDSFGMLENLQNIDLSQNALEGKVSETHFTKLKNLKSFKASGNRLVLRVNPEWVSPFQHIEELELGSWHVGPLFPAWLRPLKHLHSLDLSNSKISSTLPIWFLNMSLSSFVINLSHNQMHGNIPYINFSAGDLLDSYIDLSSNHFEGPLPQVSSNLRLLDLSNNSFSGSISNFLCGSMHEINAMTFLNLGKNNLYGELPNCWENWKNLRDLTLSDNNFSGKFPPSIGTLSEIEFLDIHNNNMSGEIPLSLQNWKNLNALDLRDNELGGDISTWTTGEQLPQLVILNLRRNKFHGQISEKLCHMASLQILDLADNNLSGSIPKCISNLTAMKTEYEQLSNEYEVGTVIAIESSAVVSKGRVMEYDTILPYVRSFDLSNNKLSGEIPEEITSLIQLQSLNLSNNLLDGTIPEDMGAMQSLESLDFSENQLIGEIPQSMANLSYLNYLNLSYNKLTGKIPVSTQLGSLEASSFIGNNLSGPPLTKDPRDTHTVQIEKKSGTADEEAEVVDLFYLYVSIAPGFVVGFWAVVAPLAFNRRWRHLYFAYLNQLWNKICECF